MEGGIKKTTETFIDSHRFFPKAMESIAAYVELYFCCCCSGGSLERPPTLSPTTLPCPLTSRNIPPRNSRSRYRSRCRSSIIDHTPFFRHDIPGIVHDLYTVVQIQFRKNMPHHADCASSFRPATPARICRLGTNVSAHEKV